MKIPVAILFFCFLIGCPNSFCWSDDYSTQSIGNFDYVTGSDGYSGTGQQIEDFYYYSDDE